jgi:DNA-binding CsgD family transcriptional regulator
MSDNSDNYNKRDRRPTKSDRYQNFFAESAHSHDMMEAFSNTDSMYSRLNPWNYNEELVNLEEQLKVEFWRVVDTLLTDRQKEVIRLYSQGKTQMEIAKILKVNQSSITKSLNRKCRL